MMKRALLALLMLSSLVAVAQDPKAKAAAKPAPAAKPAAPAAKPAATPAAPAAKAAPAGAILANKESKTYHRADCKMAAKMKEANKVSFASAAEADKAGHKPCKVCKP
jgi:hypothetical protein